MCCKIRKICKIKFVKFDLQSATQYSHFRRIFIIIAVFNDPRSFTKRRSSLFLVTVFPVEYFFEYKTK
jgi:hypothetical protein